MAARAGHRCEYCLAPEAAFNLAFEVEHIIPPGRGGSIEMENLALACRASNLFKSDALDAVDRLTSSVVRLYDPRRDDWSNHFVVLPDGMIEGSSDVGRATVERLRLNAAAHMEARRLWMRVGLYPP